MRVKYISYWLFFPLFAILLANGAIGCSNDPVMEETTSGKSTLSITVRGVTTTVPTDGDYDEYIKTLRVIGYDAEGTVVCNQMHQGAELSLVTGEDAILINQSLEESFQGGTCIFYFIANEEGYSVYNSSSTTLSSFLGGNPDKTDLESCIVSFAPTADKIPGNYPILMTASSSSQYLKPGDNQMGTISLIRSLAKIQLKVLKNENYTGDMTVSGVKLQGTYPDSYSLWDTQQYTGYQSTSIDAQLNNADNTTPFTSRALYFPEKLGKNADTDTDLKFTFSLAAEGVTNNYEIGIGAGDQNQVTDYNIYRNHWYVTTATFIGWQSLININYSVADWTQKDIELEYNYPTTVCSPVKEDNYSTEVYYVNTTDLSTKLAAAFGLKFSMTAPANQKWTVTLDGGNYDIMVFDYLNQDITNAPEQWISGEELFYIYVIPNQPYSEDSGEGILRISTLTWGGENDLLLINEAERFNSANSPSQTEIRIQQVEEPSSSQP